MNEKLGWVFEMVDKMSAPAAKIAQATKNLGNELGGVQGIAKSMASADLGGIFDKIFGGGTTSIGNMKMALPPWLSAMKEAITLVVGLGVAGTGLWAVGAGFALKSLAFKENMMTSLKLMTGTEKKATEVFNRALTFAKKTPFETEDVLSGYKGLMAAGFSADEAGLVFKGLGDVASASGFNTQVIGQLTYAFGQIKAAGKLMGQDLMQVINATSSAGIGKLVIFDHIAKTLGKTRAEVVALQGAGKLDADTAIYGIMSAIKEKSGGTLGNIMDQQSGTITGLLSTIKSIPSDFIQSMGKIDSFPGFKELKGALTNLIKLFGEGSGAAQSMQEYIRDALGGPLKKLFAQFSGVEGLKLMKELFEGFLGALKIGISFLQGFWAVLQGIFDATRPAMLDLIASWQMVFGNTKRGTASWEQLGYAIGMILNIIIVAVQMIGLVVGGLAYIFNGLWSDLADIDWAYMWDGFKQAISDLWEWVKEKFGQLGEFISEGLAKGIELASAPIKAVTGLADRIAGAFTGKMEIGSPSRLFEEYGENTAEGYRLGLMSGRSGIEDSVNGLGVAATPGDIESAVRGSGSTGATATTASASRGGGSATVNLTLNVDARGGDGDGIASKLRELLPSILADAFDQMAAQEGV